MHKALVFLFLFLGSLSSWATGGMNSGGGTGYTMPDGTVHLVDSYEATHYQLSLDLGTPGLSVQDRVQQILTRLAPIMPARAKDYQTFASTFFSEIEWIGPGEQIDNPSDLEGVIVPAGATLVQLAFQRSDSELAPGLKRYVIDQTNYNKLSADDQVALLMHEIIYHDLLSFDIGSSEQTRYINEHILDKNFNWHAYVQLMAMKYFGRNEYLGVYDNPTDPRYPTTIEYTAESAQNTSACLGYNNPTRLSEYAVNSNNVAQLQQMGYIDARFGNLSSPLIWTLLWNNGCLAAGATQQSIIYNFEVVSWGAFTLNTSVESGQITASGSTLPDSGSVTPFYYSGYEEDFRYQYAVDGQDEFKNPDLYNFIFDQMQIAYIPGKPWLQAKSEVVTAGQTPQFARYREYGPAATNSPWSDAIDINNAAVTFGNGTGFAKGSITLQNVAQANPTQWTVVSVSVDQASNLPAPKVGDVIQVQ